MMNFDEIENAPSSLDGWTKDEKFLLLQALKEFPCHDVEKIGEKISTKTTHEIVLAMNHYKKVAIKNPVFKKSEIKPKKKNSKPTAPLTKWEKLLDDNIPNEDLRTETATAVRMIADLEKFPDPTLTENIDFRKIYHTIADAMEGKPLQPDITTAAVLNKCLVETAMSSKAFMKTSALKNVINSINLDDKDVNTFSKPRATENPELGVLRNLAAQRNYNPLRIPDNFMQPSCDTERSENGPPEETLPTDTPPKETNCSKDAVEP